MTGRSLERARREALRCGSDPGVFVRELLRNAGDARARSVDLQAGEVAAAAVLVCLNDGVGTTFEHARRFLSTLYASSEEGARGTAGRFGVGFCSVLRFEPSRIVVRSWPKRGEPIPGRPLGAAEVVHGPVDPRGGDEPRRPPRAGA